MQRAATSVGAAENRRTRGYFLILKSAFAALLAPETLLATAVRRYLPGGSALPLKRGLNVNDTGPRRSARVNLLSWTRRVQRFGFFLPFFFLGGFTQRP